MITPNMTNSELVKEFNKQIEQLAKKAQIDYGLDILKEIKRDVKKLKPASRRNYFSIKVRSLYFNFNEWHIFFYCGKKGFKIRCLCRVEDKVKKMSKYLYVDDNISIKIYSGHFFSRYKSRFLDRYSSNLRRSGILAHFFMVDNIAGNYYFKNKTPNREVTSEFYEVYDFGIGLCRKDIDNDILEVNTFLPYEELKRSQLESLHVNLIYHHGKMLGFKEHLGEKNRVEIFLWRKSEAIYKLATVQIAKALEKYGVDMCAYEKKLRDSIIRRRDDDVKNFAKFIENAQIE